MVNLSSFLGGAAGGASINIVIRAIDNYSKELRNVEVGLKNTSKIAGNLFKPAMFAATAALGAFAVSSFNAAVQMEPIKRGFQDLAEDSTNFLKSLNEATVGTVNNFELMKAANNALLLGIDQDALPQMFEAAAIVGQAAGRTTTQAIEDITIGIGRQSRLILDNLGIIVDVKKAHEDFAAALGITASELDETQKKAAFTEAALRGLEERAISLGGELETTTSVQIAQLTKNIDDLKVEIGEFLALAANPLLEWLLDLIDVLKNPSLKNFATTPLGFLSGTQPPNSTPSGSLSSQARPSIPAPSIPSASANTNVTSAGELFKRTGVLPESAREAEILIDLFNRGKLDSKISISMDSVPLTANTTSQITAGAGG